MYYDMILILYQEKLRFFKMELYTTFTSLNGLSLFLPMLGIEPKAQYMT